MFDVFAVNMGAGMAKDRALAQMFGTASPRPMAWSSFGFFAIRDTVTIAAAFTLPDRVSNALQQEPGSSAGSSSFMGGVISMNASPAFANISSQILLPMAVQVNTESALFTPSSLALAAFAVFGRHHAFIPPPPSIHPPVPQSPIRL